MSRIGGPVRRALAGGLLMFALFALVSSGTTGSGDAMVRFRVADSILDGHGSALTRASDQTLVGRGGRLYSVYGIGQSLLFIVADAPVRGACALVGCSQSLRVDLAVALASLLIFPAVSALAVVFLILLLEELGFDRGTTTVMSVLIPVGSLMLPYAKVLQEESQILTLTFGAAYFACRFMRSGDARDAVIAAVLSWAPLLFRLTGLAEAVPFSLLLLIASRRRSWPVRVRVVTTLAAVALGVGAWLLFFNWYRFGSVMETGYGQLYTSIGMVRTNMLPGLAGPLVHPSKSLFVYSPLLVLAIGGARRAWRSATHRALLLTALAVLGLAILIPSRLGVWGGDNAWGPRHEVAGHALLLVFVAGVFARWSALSRPARVGIGAVVAVAISVQLAGTAFNHNLEYQRGLLRSWDYTPQSWVDIDRAQLAMRLRSLVEFRHHWTEASRPPIDAVEEYSIPAFLPWKLGQKFGPSVWTVTVLVWISGLVVWTLGCGLYLRSGFARVPSDNTFTRPARIAW